MGADEIIPDDQPKEKKVGFWQKHTPEELSKKQKWFDLIFGIILPIVFLYFDPFVFRSDGLWGEYQLFLYLAIFIGIIFLLLQLFWSQRFQELQAVKTGVLFTGGVFALILGIAMLPLSIIGTIFAGIGLLGFSPFFTAFVFTRNGKMALRRAEVGATLTSLTNGILIGVILALVVPVIIQVGANQYVEKSFDMVINGGIEEGNEGARRLQWAFWCSDSCYDEIVWAYCGEEDESRQEFLSAIYEELTGDDIKDRLRILMEQTRLYYRNIILPRCCLIKQFS